MGVARVLLIVACGGCQAVFPLEPPAQPEPCPIDQVGQTRCDSACVDTVTDVANCGGCGISCAAGELCTDAVCTAPCDVMMLRSAITDPWGTSWDALERTPLPLDAAALDCAAFGGRLPTAT